MISKVSMIVLGNQAGDDVLRALADLLGRNIRSMDTAARYGGEEFVLILPESDQASACASAERLRQMVERLPLQWLPGRRQFAPERVTISIVCGAGPQHAAEPAALLRPPI